MKQLNQTVNAGSGKEIKVWDIFVRFFHWALVLAFVTAYLSEDDYMSVHEWAGYSVLSLIAVRIVWGLIGTRYARFSNFIYPPKEITSFVKDTVHLKAKRYIGHNPAGGAMVILLILSLLITGLTGMSVFAIEEHQGPFASLMSGMGEFWEDAFEEVHEFFANFTLFLVLVHVAGVIVESLIHGENLVKSMINGRKRAE
jgi:cytochrome b